jgi:hypothetical protein
MPYSYDDFLSAATSSGLLGEFSQADLETAKKYPEFGLSILSLKRDYHDAATDEQKLLANEAANQLRSSYGNYMGGSDGGSYYSQGKIPGQIDAILDQINNYGSFTFDQEAPVYDNQYAEQQQALLDAILNREDFSWSKETDPQWSSYKKSYLREGDRATANALAQASAASGGRASTAAITAATQAGDYYATQLNDIIPTLYQQAYDRYLNEYSMMLQDLGAVNTQEQLDYAKYLDQLTQYNTDRNFAYDTYLGDFNVLQGKLSSLQGQDDVDYGRYLDQINLGIQKDETEYQRGQQEQALAQAQVDAILSAGGTPSAELISASGYTSEYVQTLEDAYRKAEAERTSTRSGSGGVTGYNNGSLTTSQIIQMQQALGVTADGKWGPETQAAAGGLSADAAWEIMNQGSDPGDADAEADVGASVTNQTGDGWIRVAGYSRITWQELEAMVNRGEIIETYNPETGKYSYRKNPDYKK